MDIRNFFGGSGGGSKASKAKTSAKSPTRKPSSRKRSSNAMKEKETKEATEETRPEAEETEMEIEKDSRKPSPTKRSKRSNPSSQQPTKSKRKRPPMEDSDSETDEDFEPKPKPKPKQISPKKIPKKRKAPSKTSTPPLLIKPTQPIESYPHEEATPNILANLTFCITGQLTSLSREEATEYIKILGGRVTTGVSGKTSYLVAGETLEDGRQVKEGKKYKKAQELNTSILNGEEEMYGLVKTLDDNLKKDPSNETTVDTGSNGTEAKSNNDAPSEEKVNANSPVVKNPYARNSTPKNSSASFSSATTTTPPKNPYAKAAPKNPYAKNPYTSKPVAATSTPTPKGTVGGGGRAEVTDPNALWADKYAPNSTRSILGNADNVRKLSSCKYHLFI